MQERRQNDFYTTMQERKVILILARSASEGSAFKDALACVAGW